MKFLIIICGHMFDINWCDSIKILDNYMKLLDIEVYYCGISNQDDFHNYEHIISFKYKIINSAKQFHKICDFITDYKTELDYDWYMKIRPDVKLLENINFDMLSENSINARARVYNGPRKIKYGKSVCGEGIWKNIRDSGNYADTESGIILDDQLFIFHKNIIQLNVFDNNKNFDTINNNEWIMTEIYNRHNINLNVIGIYMCLVCHNVYSGDINMN